jgi:hypothetical protein
MTLPRARPSAVGSDLISTAVASRNADRDGRRRCLRRTCRFADSALLNGTIPDQRLYEHISLVAAWWIHARRATGLDRPARLGAMAASHRRALYETRQLSDSRAGVFGVRNPCPKSTSHSYAGPWVSRLLGCAGRRDQRVRRERHTERESATPAIAEAACAAAILNASRRGEPGWGQSASG